MKTTIKQYASVDELTRAAVNNPSELSNDVRHSRSRQSFWAGGSWTEAVDLAQKGDVKRARRLSPAILEVANTVVNGTPRLDPVYRLDEGRWIDVARYVRGEPECWGDMVEADPIPRKGVNVLVAIGAPGNVSADAIDKVGIAIGGTLLGLHAKGYVVNLHIVVKYDAGVILHAPFNPGGSVLDIAKLAGTLQPWYFRRIIFSLMETWDAKLRERLHVPHRGYGRPAFITQGEAETLTGQKDVAIIEVFRIVDNPRSIQNTILKQITGGQRA